MKITKDTVAVVISQPVNGLCGVSVIDGQEKWVCGDVEITGIADVIETAYRKKLKVKFDFEMIKELKTEWSRN